MKCPIETHEHAELLAWCAGRLDPERKAALERHWTRCAACREFAGSQRAVWEALDAWEAAPVSPDFDRRLYQRIASEVSWWDLLVRPFRPLLIRQGLPIAAAAGLLVMAGVILQRPAGVPPVADPESARIESVQPEQVEHALDDLEMLGEFSHVVRADSDSNSKM